MSDNIGGLLCVVCLDVCAGFCYDFQSLRHAFTENICSCSYCRCSACCRAEEDEYETGEREPLLNGQNQPASTTADMPSQPPMQVKRP
ncbi:hypothetical protein C8R43DRAFT_1046924 [Mycena crocata]|nr:hypothetical protein C8R43DRAFT_1046924 [Mycena crocata]